ncbi:MAG: UDP-N-acetylmuramoyl-tripeptide--D-alanyl-D-alanine ligase [Actinobacteria bacterium]|nr:UDP-N-acetylmuramoyl-tripeptide--D-alanyl-D-alanine ligase [Actinomycetota bacterium]
MIPFSVREIADVVGGRMSSVDPETMVRDVTVDSRAAGSGAMYVAIAGERVDGHDFAEAAESAGCVVCLTDRVLVRTDGSSLPCVIVDDPVLALGRLARLVRIDRLTCKVVAITGSSGKTSTKDLLAFTLAGIGTTVRAEGSFNTEVGVPLTILAADERTEFLVVEMGMRGEGHISYLVDIARPDVGVVVNVGSAHIGMLGTREAIARAKGELVAGLPATATAVLNTDDTLVRSMVGSTAAAVVTFGESADADVRATDVRLDAEARPSFTLTDGRPGHDEAVPVSLQFSGEHYVSNALAAAAAALSLGGSLEQVADGLRAATPQSRWRMEVRESPDGVTIVNDAYNANPESMRAALKTLVAMAAGRRTWAVLGEMRELGDESMVEHDAIGRLAVRLDISRLLCVGAGTRVMHLAASNEGSWGEESAFAPDVESALLILREELRPGDVVLVKASRSVGLERIAAELLGDLS